MKLIRYLECERDLPRRSNILKLNVGDHILYERNAMFRKIRDTFFDLGFGYTTVDSLNYFSNKLGALDKMKKLGVIPYLPNNRGLKQIEKANPGMFKLEDIHKLQIKWNPVNHESCHLIFSYYCSKMLFRGQPKSSRETILLAQFEESFTDTVEIFLQLKKVTALEQFAIYFNSYIYVTLEKRRLLLQALDKSNGEFEFAKVLMLLTIWAHFLNEKLDLSTYLMIAKFLSIEPEVFKKQYPYNVCCSIFSVVLPPAISSFRTGVAEFYFKSQGFKGPLNRILDFNPIKLLLENREEYTILLEKLKPLFQ